MTDNKSGDETEGEQPETAAYQLFRRELATRITRLIGAYPTKVEAARIAGVTPEQISRYEKPDGPKPALEVITRLAAEVGMSMDWIALGRGDPLYQPGPKLVSEYVYVPVWQIEASSGHGSVIGVEKMGSAMPFAKSLIRSLGATNERNLHVVFNRGDSNAPDIKHGDALLVDRGADRIVAEAYYVFAAGDDLFVKMIERHVDGGILVKSRNERYAPQKLSREEAEAITVFGCVRWRGGLL